RLGIGGRLGSGRQYMSWGAIDDEVGAIVHLLGAEGVVGPVNVTAPDPVTNAEVTRVLGRVLRRPTLLPTPMPALRAVFGAELVESLLASQRVSSGKLAASGFSFASPHLEPALRAVLAR